MVNCATEKEHESASQRGKIQHGLAAVEVPRQVVLSIQIPARCHMQSEYSIRSIRDAWIRCLRA